MVALGGGEGKALGDDGVLAGTAGDLQGGAQIFTVKVVPIALVLMTVGPPPWYAKDRASRSPSPACRNPRRRRRPWRSCC
jgi:hypothetical protein